MNQHSWISLDHVIVEQGPYFHTLVANRWYGSEAIEVRTTIEVEPVATVAGEHRTLAAVRRAVSRLCDALCQRSVFCDNVRDEWRQWRERKAEEERGADLMLQRIRSRWQR